MSFEGDKVAPTPSPEVVSPQKASRKCKKLPTSPLRVRCVRNSYSKQEPETEHKPWARHSDLGFGIGDKVKESDSNGFIQGQKLKRHKLKEMRFQDKGVFPKCMGRHRLPSEETLYPQYYDLKSHLFKPRYNQPKNVLKRSRDELIREMETHKEELIKLNYKYQGPWAPGTEEWKRAAKKAKKAVEEDRPKDEIDELLEEVMRELEEGVEGAAAGDVLHL
jgi:hypothetical protein